MASSLHSNLKFLTVYPLTTQPISNATSRSSIPIRCGPRDNRGPLVKGRILSTEAIQAIQALKRYHRSNHANLNDHLISDKLSRLIKSDLIAAFKELLRQDRYDLALKVFSAIRSEYKADLSQYAELVSILARKGMTEDIDHLICDLVGDGMFQCDDDKGLIRLIKALIAAKRTESTVRIYGLMKRSGWGSTAVADDYAAKLLSKGLRRLGEERVADEIDMEIGRLSRGVSEELNV